MTHSEKVKWLHDLCIRYEIYMEDVEVLCRFFDVKVKELL